MRRGATFKPPYLKHVYIAQKFEGKSYPFSVPLFKNGFDLEITRPVLIVVGENGTGKSTLIESIAYHCGFSVTGGSQNHYYAKEGRPDVASLAEVLKFSWLPRVKRGFFMRAENFVNFASFMDGMVKHAGPIALAGYGGQSLHHQSHGEAFFSLFNNRLHGQGIYIFDEPEAALSPVRQMAFLRVLNQLVQDGAQIIMATHSPILMAFPEAQLLRIEEGKLRPTTLQATPHFQQMKDFLNNPEGAVERLLAAEEE